MIHGVPEYKLLIQGVSEYIVFYNKHVPVFLPSIKSISEFNRVVYSSRQSASKIIILIHGVPEYIVLIQGVPEYIV